MLNKTQAAVVAALALLAAAPAQASGLKLSSLDLTRDSTMPDAHVLDGFGCTGGNASPALEWSGAPEGTKSFAVTAYDPDAPTGSGWWHWVVFNLPADAAGLPRGAGDPAGTALPEGAVQSRTDFGAPGYGGACPPEGHGRHRYQFTVWALDTDSLPLDASASGAMVGFYLNAHALDSATLQVVHQR